MYRSERNEASWCAHSFSSLAFYGVHSAVLSVSPKLIATSRVTPWILQVVIFEFSLFKCNLLYYSSVWSYKYAIALALKSSPASETIWPQPAMVTEAEERVAESWKREAFTYTLNCLLYGLGSAVFSSCATTPTVYSPASIRWIQAAHRSHTTLFFLLHGRACAEGSRMTQRLWLVDAQGSH
jgi:hypothetical protein